MHHRVRRFRFLAAGLLAALAARPAAAQLACDRPLFDFGRVPAATCTVTGVFQLYNAGRDSLTVLDVLSSCGCITANIERQTLKPGAELRLPVVLDVRERSGVQRKSVFIRYRAGRGDAQTLLLSLAGTIVPGFRCQPDALDFGTISPGTAASRDVTVISDSGAPFAIREVHGFPSQVVARALSSRTATSHVVRVAPRCLDPRVPLSGVVRVDTDAAIANVVTFDVRGTVAPDVVARPSAIFANAGDALECRLSLVSPVGRRFRVTGVATSDPRLRAAVVPAASPPAVLVTAPSPAGALDGQYVRIRTDLDDCPSVEVVVHAVRPDGRPPPGRRP